jgi:hypothetical protein
VATVSPLTCGNEGKEGFLTALRAIISKFSDLRKRSGAEACAAVRLWELPAWDLRELAAGRADLQPSRAGSAAGHGDAAP